MTRSVRLSCLAIVIIVTHGHHALAQDSAVGLYYPDLRAMRMMIGPTGIANLPAGSKRTKLEKAWNQLSREGRELLLKERDLALVVLDSNGRWLYRTTGVHTLRSLPGANRPKNDKDLANLLPILNDVWFQKLREFFDRLLFTANTPSAPAAFGELLADVNKTSGLAKAEKDWFRSIVGAELRGMDNVARRSLLLNKKYGNYFVDAIALAEVTRNAQLRSVANGIVDGPKFTITLNDAGCHFATAEEFNLTDLNVRFIKGKKLLEMSSRGSVCWLVPKDGDAEWPASFDRKKFTSLLESGKLMVWVSAHGTKTVWGVKPEKKK